MAKLKAAVVGTGSWGRTHIEAYWRNPDVQLVAICARYNRERAERLGEIYGTHVYFDIGQMIRAEKPDLVSVVLPDAGHYQGYKAVIEAGVNCLLEKPLAMEMNEARELVQLARSRKMLCGINFNHRFTPPFLMLRKYVQEGKIGKPHQLSWRFTGGHYPEGAKQPLAHLLYMQCHGFNAMTAFGGEVENVAGFAADPRGTRQYTTASLSLKFKNGAVGSFVASVDGDYNEPGVYTFEIMGDKGRAVVSDAIGKFEYFPLGKKTGEVISASFAPGFFDDDGRSFTKTTDRHIAEIVRAIREGKPEPIPVEEGLVAIELAAMAIKSCLAGVV